MNYYLIQLGGPIGAPTWRTEFRAVNDADAADQTRRWAEGGYFHGLRAYLYRLDAPRSELTADNCHLLQRMDTDITARWCAPER